MNFITVNRVGGNNIICFLEAFSLCFTDYGPAWRDSLHNILFHDRDSKVVFFEYTSDMLLMDSDALSCVRKAILVKSEDS
jgi:hypothetical protein